MLIVRSTLPILRRSSLRSISSLIQPVLLPNKKSSKITAAKVTRRAYLFNDNKKFQMSSSSAAGISPYLPTELEDSPTHNKLLNSLLTSPEIHPILSLIITNNSHLHNVKKGTESHFTIQLCSSNRNYKTLKPLGRHKLLNSICKYQLSANVGEELGIHALTLVLKDDVQFEAMGNTFDLVNLPKCGGGDGSLPPKKS